MTSWLMTGVLRQMGMPVADGFTFFAAAALKSARERSRVTTLAEVPPPLAAVRSGPARRAGAC